MKDLKSLTIEESKKIIKSFECKNVYQVYIIERKTINRDSFKTNKRVHEHNSKGERIYHKWTFKYIVYANNDDLENKNIVIDSYIEKGQHSYFSLNGGASNSYEHNIYYLVVEHLQKRKQRQQVFKRNNKSRYTLQRKRTNQKTKEIYFIMNDKEELIPIALTYDEWEQVASAYISVADYGIINPTICEILRKTYFQIKAETR